MDFQRKQQRDKNWRSLSAWISRGKTTNWRSLSAWISRGNNKDIKIEEAYRHWLPHQTTERWTNGRRWSAYKRFKFADVLKYSSTFMKTKLDWQEPKFSRTTGKSWLKYNEVSEKNKEVLALLLGRTSLRTPAGKYSCEPNVPLKNAYHGSANDKRKVTSRMYRRWQQNTYPACYIFIQSFFTWSLARLAAVFTTQVPALYIWWHEYICQEIVHSVFK